MYEYRIKIVKHVDGDTTDVEVDLGFKIKFVTRVRWAGINTPELRDIDPEVRERALDAKARVEELLPVGTNCFLRTKKDSREQWGRYLGTFLLTLDATTSVNQMLLDEGLAVVW